MIKVFNKTSVGYSHLKNKKPCQDFSANYHDDERTVITVCDGHGGDLYVRSALGSRFASRVIFKVFTGLMRSAFRKYRVEEIAEKIKLNVLCEWNELVENSLAEEPLTKRELEGLDESGRFQLKVNPVKAYGTTLIGAAVIGNKAVCVQIGDGGCFLIKKGVLYPVFDEDETAVANLTYSMCGEDAYQHIKVNVCDFKDYDGVLCCTDGVLNPYENLDNFNRYLVNPVVCKLLEGNAAEVENFVINLGVETGIGDDVSLSVILKSTALKKYYQER